MMNKPKIVKDYHKVDEQVLDQVKLTYPRGFEKHLVKFKNRDGLLISALPFETEDKYYLLRMTLNEARDIVEDDDDYNDDGILKAAVSKNEISEKIMQEMEEEE